MTKWYLFRQALKKRSYTSVESLTQMPCNLQIEPYLRYNLRLF